MRRFVPVLIVIIGVAALIIDFWPGLKLPDFANPDGGSRPVETKLGLDLSGGLRVEYQALPAGGKTPSQGDLNTIKDIIERRVNATGVSEPLVQTQGSDRIVVEIPGVSDPDSIRKLIGATGRLDFVPLPTDRFGSNTNPGPERADQGRPLPTPAIPPL
jgi:preprotein translocase subunit SecD